MSAHDDAAAIVAEPDFASDPVRHIASALGRAADADQLGYASAARLTHVAALLVDAADNPQVVRGAVLDGLIARYGEPRA